MPDERLSAEELQQQANEAGGRQWNAWEGDAEYNAAQEAAAARGNPPPIVDPDVDVTADPRAVAPTDEDIEAVGGRPSERALRERARREEAAATLNAQQDARSVAREADHERREQAQAARKAEKPAEDAVKRETKRSDKKD